MGPRRRSLILNIGLIICNFYTFLNWGHRRGAILKEEASLVRRSTIIKPADPSKKIKSRGMVLSYMTKERSKNSKFDPELVATRIGQLWTIRTHQPQVVPNVMQNENRVMFSQTSRNVAESNDDMMSSDWFMGPTNGPRMMSSNDSGMMMASRLDMNAPMSFSSDLSHHPENGLAMKRRNARVFLDKQRREWKVEWIEDSSKKMKRFSCKRWGKAKAHASALEYYYMVIKGLPVDPARPFFSQVRKLMEKSEQSRKTETEKPAKYMEEDMKSIFTRKQASGGEDSRHMNIGTYSDRLFDKAEYQNDKDLSTRDNALFLARTCGNLTVDVMCNAMNNITSLHSNSLMKISDADKYDRRISKEDKMLKSSMDWKY